MRTIHYLAVVSLLVFSACTEPGRTTAVSAATGGALGAGLGAIVGNQVGSAGAGLAIGAAAGTAAGAAVGNAFEAHDKKLVAQDESIKRHEEAIKVQRTEISELRKMNQDATAAGGNPTGDSYAWNNAGSGDARYASPAEIVAARQRLRQEVSPSAQHATNAPLMAAPIEERAQLNSRTIAPASSGGLNETQGPGIGRPAPALVGKSSGVIEKNIVDSPPIETQPSHSAVSEKTIEAPAADTGVNSNTAKLAPAVMDSEDCKSAQTEVSKAERVTDNADKLFHIRRALRMCPASADYHNELGVLYRNLGREDDAKFEFQEALKLNPTLQSAKENLQMENKTPDATSKPSKGGTMNDRY